jgi:translocation and assembly module TamA
MRALGSGVDFQRLMFDGQALWNVRDLAPPLIVLGMRGSVASTVIGAGPEHLAELPPMYRHFLGSSTNMRGFAREALPTGGKGALTAAYLGLEARLAAGLPAGLQPLLFYDMGKTGRTSLQLDRPLYYSPGLGMRWQSPLGSLRLTAARGMVAHASADERRGLERWVFYLSFGEEF